MKLLKLLLDSLLLMILFPIMIIEDTLEKIERLREKKYCVCCGGHGKYTEIGGEKYLICRYCKGTGYTYVR